MTKAGSPDLSMSRATIIAAVIMCAGSIFGGAFWGGRKVGERGTESSMARLEERLSQQERDFSALQAQVVERDARIRSLSARLEDSSTPAVPVAPRTPEATPVNMPQDRPTESFAVERVAPFQVSLQGCEHMGGGLTCSLQVENTSSGPANLALNSRGTVIIVDGSECRLQDARLGSRPWNSHWFGGNRLEAGVPLLAELQFKSVPSASTSGILRIFVAVLQGSGVRTSDPGWQSVMFKEITLR